MEGGEYQNNQDNNKEVTEGINVKKCTAQEIRNPRHLGENL